MFLLLCLLSTPPSPPPDPKLVGVVVAQLVGPENYRTKYLPLTAELAKSPRDHDRVVRIASNIHWGFRFSARVRNLAYDAFNTKVGQVGTIAGPVRVSSVIAKPPMLVGKIDGYSGDVRFEGFAPADAKAGTPCTVTGYWHVVELQPGRGGNIAQPPVGASMTVRPFSEAVVRAAEVQVDQTLRRVDESGEWVRKARMDAITDRKKVESRAAAKAAAKERSRLARIAADSAAVRARYKQGADYLELTLGRDFEKFAALVGGRPAEEAAQLRASLRRNQPDGPTAYLEPAKEMRQGKVYGFSDPMTLIECQDARTAVFETEDARLRVEFAGHDFSKAKAGVLYQPIPGVWYIQERVYRVTDRGVNKIAALKVPPADIEAAQRAWREVIKLPRPLPPE